MAASDYAIARAVPGTSQEELDRHSIQTRVILTQFSRGVTSRAECERHLYLEAVSHSRVMRELLERSAQLTYPGELVLPKACECPVSHPWDSECA